MKKNFFKTITIILCVVTESQMTLATPTVVIPATPAASASASAGVTEPQAAASAPSPEVSAKASAEAERTKNIEAIMSGVDDNLQTDYKYTITLSDGFAPADRDVLITRRSGKTYTFKYCKAFRSDGSKTPIYRIQLLHSKFSDIFSKQPQGNEILKKYFDSADCLPFVDNSVYVEKDHYSVRSNVSNTGPSSVITGAASAVGAIVGSWTSYISFEEFIDSRKENITLGIVKYVFSKNSPKLTPIVSMTLIGATTFGVFETVQMHRDNVSIDAVADASYSRYYAFGEHDEKDFEQMVPSMDEFKLHFVAGLQILLKHGYFVKL